jgi:hypothetical protein
MIRIALLISAVTVALLTAAPTHAQITIEQIVRQKVQSILPENGKGGGVAIAVRMRQDFVLFLWAVFQVKLPPI